MENLDVMVLCQLRDWLQAGKRALLATVVRTWGSSPRPVGSIMALCEDGAVVGSVSGGCIEDDLIYRCTSAYAQQGCTSRIERQAGAADRDEMQGEKRSNSQSYCEHFQRGSSPESADAHGATMREEHPYMPSGAPEFVKYGVTADEAHRFGLPCGGTLELLLEYTPDADSLAELVRALEAGRLVQRRVRLADGAVQLADATAPEALALTATELVNTFGPRYRMLLIGAGQLTEYLATMALFCGFAVTVCDPRKEYRSAWRVAGATLVDGMPDDVVLAFQPDRRSCVLALTHDPKLDDLALLEALGTEAFYVGAIGSRRNNQARHLRMIEHFDQTPESLNHLRGPIGIYVGSKTPPEIAVSVMAEILAVKNGVTLPRDMGVAQAKNEREPQQPPDEPGLLVCGMG
ncbi:MAG: XdhC family protein [Acidovorax sp.]